MPTQTSASPSLGKQLFDMTWPMLFGILSMMSFQLVDSAFIGQLGVLPLAAQGFTLPIQMIIIGIQVGLGIATTAIIARALGAERVRYAKQLGGLVVIIGSVGIAIICLLLWLCRNLLLALLSAPDDVYATIDAYWPYWLISAWVGAVLYFYYSLCRANGNTMLPGLMMIFTSVLNMLLDPLFIFTFGLGLEGAAMATIVAFAIGLLAVMPKVMKNHWLSLDWSNLNVYRSVSEIAHIMGPAMISQLLPPISSMLATKLIAGFGTAAVAAWALGSRFEFFVIVPVLALTMSMPPMIGRLLGAKNLAEVRQLISIASRFVIISQLVIAVLAFVGASSLAQLLSGEESVANILSWHLMLVPVSLGALGLCMVMVSVSNAMGRSYTALTISALRLFAFFLPCIWLGSEIGGLQGVFVGVLVGNLLAGLCAWVVCQKALRRVEADAQAN
ncbi:MATE family efflux transporter [Marinomonas sp.]